MGGPGCSTVSTEGQAHRPALSVPERGWLEVLPTTRASVSVQSSPKVLGSEEQGLFGGCGSHLDTVPTFMHWPNPGHVVPGLVPTLPCLSVSPRSWKPGDLLSLQPRTVPAPDLAHELSGALHHTGRGSEGRVHSPSCPHHGTPPHTHSLLPASISPPGAGRGSGVKGSPPVSVTGSSQSRVQDCRQGLQGTRFDIPGHH